MPEAVCDKKVWTGLDPLPAAARSGSLMGKSKLGASQPSRLRKPTVNVTFLIYVLFGLFVGSSRQPDFKSGCAVAMGLG